ncbi:hypothetical protein POM88_052104 [Heracleum sosnowskyi]|uniref:Uncharacterized protein n=1 Tax=Heracleum sosnowskyi TaxID=360622 RepID=A0AAD8GSK2_9APIA|nr:hypothetical protein POM88_052104 [Heracleum sosnowskyi]
MEDIRKWESMPTDCLVNVFGNLEILSIGTIVKLLPKLKRLYMDGADLSKENLLLIMRGCKELECLNVRDCIGFKENDEEILKLSSSIRNFRCDGSTLYDDSDCYMDIYDGDDCSD